MYIVNLSASVVGRRNTEYRHNAEPVNVGCNVKPQIQMLRSDRIVIQLPLTTLWTDDGETNAVREKHVGREEIKKLLKLTTVIFVVADLGRKLTWISSDKCYEFWKQEVQEHVADNPDKIILDDFKEGYAFIASQWRSKDQQPIVLLEKFH